MQNQMSGLHAGNDDKDKNADMVIDDDKDNNVKDVLGWF